MKSEALVKEDLGKLPIRPVYLVSCEHQGRRNIITVGMFAYFSGEPMLLGIGLARSRFSYELIKESRAYVVNVVDEKLVDAVRICGENSGWNIDKFALAKLTPVASSKISAPRIQESPLSIECKVAQVIEAGDHVWFIGEVLATHLRKGFDWKDGLLFKWVGKEGFYHKVGKRIARY